MGNGRDRGALWPSPGAEVKRKVGSKGLGLGPERLQLFPATGE